MGHRCLKCEWDSGWAKVAMESAFLFEVSAPLLHGGPVPESKERRVRQKRTIQDLRLFEGVVAVQESVNCVDLDELRTRVTACFDQNSQETKLRYARFVIANFFRDGLDGIARKTWMAYQDEKILLDVLRYLYLQHEPVMGACVAECLFPLEIGMRIPAAVFERFLYRFFDGEPTQKTSKRLKMNLKVLGMLERRRGEDDRLISPGPNKISLLILLHWIFAANGQRTIELQRLFADPFWKYLGLKSEDEVRRILREADAAGLIAKYIVADQLEQVTTCLTLDELLAKKARL